MSSPSAAAGPEASATGVIHDIGYRRYDGPRLGRAYAARSLFVHSLRTAYGLGRTAGAKVFPIIIMVILLGYAAVVVTVQSRIPMEDLAPGQERWVEYWRYPTSINFLVLFFVAVAAPALVSRDLRGGVLQLYFSRPVTRADYPLAKYAALVTAIFLMLLAPLFLLFLGNAFAEDTMSQVWDEFVAFTEGLVISAILAALYAAIALLISSLSGRRAVAAAITVAFFLLTFPVVGILQVIAYAQSRSGPFGGSELTGAAEQLYQLSGLASPLSIVQGIADWLYKPAEPPVGPFGPLYLGATVGIIVLCLALTLLRYRKVAR